MTRNEKVFQSVSRNRRLASSTASRLNRNESHGLWRGEEVPAEGVRPLALDDRPGLDHVALALGHLLAVGVEDQPQADHVAERAPVEEEHALGQQRVEPAAGLVDGLADEVGREAPLQRVRPRERVRVLGVGHRAAVVPDVDDLGDALHLPAAAAAQADVVDVGPVGVEVRRDLVDRPLAQLGEAADADRARRSRGSARWGGACPSSARARWPSRRCPRATGRSGRRARARGASRRRG